MDNEASDSDDYKPYITLKQKRQMVQKEQEMRKMAKLSVAETAEHDVPTAGPKAKVSLLEISQKQPEIAKNETEEIVREEQRLLDELEVRPLLSNKELSEGIQYHTPLTTSYVFFERHNNSNFAGQMDAAEMGNGADGRRETEATKETLYYCRRRQYSASAYNL